VTLEIPADPADHPEFVALVRDVVRGTVASVSPALVRVFRVADWFGERYLGWSQETGTCSEPPFSADRLRARSTLVRSGADYEIVEAPPPGGLPSSVVSVWFAATADDALLVSVMGHVVDPRFSGAWHASFGLEDGAWAFKKGVGIDEERLGALADRGR
jgi:hypothetical protein